MPPANLHPREVAVKEGELGADSFAPAVCADLDASEGALDERDRPLLGGQGHFYNKLERAMVVAMQHLPTSQRFADDPVTGSRKIAAQRR